MKEVSCDVAIIGAGSAGLAARQAAVEAGAKTLLIEAGPGGTTCARYGCMPSKLLMAAARAARETRAAAQFGVGSRAKVRIDGASVMARVRRERDHFVAGVLKDVAAIPAKERMAGIARFAGPTSLTVDDHSRVQARAIVIASGAHPSVPSDLAAACGDRLLTHETIFELAKLPTSLAVIGAGPLGIELAIAFARLGVRTVVFDEGKMIGGIADPAVQAAAQAMFERELRLHLGVKVEAKKVGVSNVRVSWRRGRARASSAMFQYVLSATGRPAAVDNLDLQMAGLALDAHNVPLFDLATLRCGDSAVFIAGDANNARPVLHEASEQGELAGSNAARYPKVKKRTPRVKLALVYSDPDMAVIGEGFDPKHEKEWVIGCSAENGRARVDGRDAGVLRAYVRCADHVIVGGEMLGPQVEHLAQMLAWLVQLKMTVEAALELPFYHPTLEESLRSCLRDAKSQLA